MAHLPAEDQKNDGHGQLYQHQDEQQDKKLQSIWNISNLFTTFQLEILFVQNYKNQHIGFLKSKTQTLAEINAMSMTSETIQKSWIQQ